MNCTNPFDGLAEGYDHHRPGYPDVLLRELATMLADVTRPRVADVGAGTGIFARALAGILGDDARITGIEPGEDMRWVAGKADRCRGRIDYCNGTAEDTGLPGAAFHLVCTAQAIHWFDRPGFYREADRILVRDCLLVVVTNDRMTEGSALLDAYEALLEAHSPGYRRDYRSYPLTNELGQLGWTCRVEEHQHRWDRQLSTTDFIGLAGTSSRVEAAYRAAGRERFGRALEQLAVSHSGSDGLVQIPCLTTLIIARKLGRTDA